MAERALSMVGPQAVRSRFQAHERLTVRQRKKWIEILLNWEAKNAYDVYDEDQQAVLRAQEIGSGFLELLKRMFLGPMRPFHVAVSDVGTSEVVLDLQRPWRFIFHRLEVLSGSGEKLGAIQRKWSWLRRIYVIEDAHGLPIGEIFGPILRPWTFEIRDNQQTIGVIRKRWSGFGKELFTDADNFGVELGTIPDPMLRALAFAATVLIDVVHFERAKG